MPETKICKDCKEPLPLSSFTAAPSCKDGLSNRCKPCTVKVHSSRYQGEGIKRETDKYMTLEEWKAFKAAEDDPLWLLYWNLLAKCGLRKNEGLGLGPADLSVVKGTLAIATLKRQGRPVFDIDVPPDLVEELQRIDAPNGRWFHWNSHAVWRRFKFVAKKAKVNIRLAPHSLRHLYGMTVADITGGDIVKVAKALRHKGLKIAETYVHVSPKLRREIAKKTWEGM